MHEDWLLQIIIKHHNSESVYGSWLIDICFLWGLVSGGSYFDDFTPIS